MISYLHPNIARRILQLSYDKKKRQPKVINCSSKVQDYLINVWMVILKSPENWSISNYLSLLICSVRKGLTKAYLESKTTGWLPASTTSTKWDCKASGTWLLITSSRSYSRKELISKQNYNSPNANNYKTDSPRTSLRVLRKGSFKTHWFEVWN